MSRYPADMDPECIKLCDALNTLPGVVTTESCSGHGEEQFCIFFNCSSFESLGSIASNLDAPNWRLSIGFLEGLYFVLKGPPGAYAEADALAEILVQS